MINSRNYFTFDGKNSIDFGVYISGSHVFDAPERDEELIEVPGRNGALTLDKGRYKNQVLKYPAFILRQFNFSVEGLRNYLLAKRGYFRLEDSYHPQEYRLAKWSGGFEVGPHASLVAGTFDITFTCYPQRFLKEGEKLIEITGATSIYNPYPNTALPLIRAYGTGSFTIGGVTAQITAADSYTDIDCDLQEAYKDSLATNKNANIRITGDFPSLEPGANAISLSGITKLELTPRWWIL